MRIASFKTATLLAAALVLAIPVAEAQKPAGQRLPQEGARSALPSSRPTNVSHPGKVAGTRAFGTITDAGFASRLGHAVTSQGFPSVPLPPGVSNINHPGMQPMPAIQPFPAGPTPPVPNIIFPGRMPDANSQGKDFPKDRSARRDGRNRRGIVYYGIPYYVPYYVPPADGSVAAASPAYGEAPLPSSQPQAPPAYLTLLAFRDHTFVMVRNYWLEGDWLYYESEAGLRMSSPLDRLDLPLTQQLNRERNVPFVLRTGP